MSEYVVKLTAKHYEIEGKDRVSDMGLAVDMAIKEKVAELGATICERFAPYDYQLDGIPHEIKSSAGTWLSIPNSEIEFADKKLSENIDLIYDIVLQLDLQSARFLGQVPYSKFKHLIEPSKFLTWRKYESGWAQERSFRVLLSKIKPLLT